MQQIVKAIRKFYIERTTNLITAAEKSHQVSRSKDHYYCCQPHGHCQQHSTSSVIPKMEAIIKEHSTGNTHYKTLMGPNKDCGKQYNQHILNSPPPLDGP